MHSPSDTIQITAIRSGAEHEEHDREEALRRFVKEDYLNWPNEAGVSLANPTLYHRAFADEPLSV